MNKNDLTTNGAIMRCNNVRTQEFIFIGKVKAIKR